jgi:preprotein translocase subunit SecA
LRTGIGLRGYGQRDPLIEYKNEAFDMFDRLMNGVDDGIVTRIYKVNVQHNQAPVKSEEPVLSKKNISTNQPAIEISEGARKKALGQNTESNKKLGRNDPCWCGSGKKYKKCHYPN